jgi:ribosomal protein S27E
MARPERQEGDMFAKLFGTQGDRRPCPICGREVATDATRCEGCGRTIAMPRTLRSVRRDQVKLAPVRLGEPPDEDLGGA